MLSKFGTPGMHLQKNLNGFTKVKEDQLFDLRDGVQMTLGNVYLDLYKHFTCLDIRKNFLIIKVINDWNKLPLEVNTAQDTTTFKIYNDKYY
jgi:hypothetical protein